MKNIFLIMLILPVVCLGQLTKRSEIALDIDAGKVVTVGDTAYIIIETKCTGSIKYNKTIEGGVESKSFTNILKPTWRSDIYLSENEAFFGIYNQLLFTIKYNYFEGWFEIKSYDYSSDDLVLMNSYKNKVYWLPIFVGDGTILLSDNLYVEGKCFHILNHELETIFQVENSDYYRNIQITYDKDYYYLILELVKGSVGKFNFIKVKREDNDIVIDKYFDLDIDVISYVKTNGHVIVCLGEGGIHLIDNSGIPLWGNDEYLIPRHDLCFINDMLYLVNNMYLLAFSIEEGTLIFKKALTEYFDEKITSETKDDKIINRVLFIEPFGDESVFLMMGQSDKGFHIDDRTKYNSQFFILNKYGLIEFQSELFQETITLWAIVKKENLELIINNKIINYEK